MTKVLIGKKDIQTDLNNFQFLKNNNEYKLIFSNTGKETINMCRTISPNIIILDSNITDMAYPEIIDNISTLPDENDKCNLILTVNNPKDKLLLNNTSIIYKILDYPLDKEEAKDTINYLARKYTLPEITTNEINILLSKLGIFPYSIGAHCLVSAIFKCYYHPEYFTTLDNLYKKVAPEFNFTTEEVKSKIRHTLDTINTSTNIDGANLYYEIFGQMSSISPKIFITMFIEYLNRIKSKK